MKEKELQEQLEIVARNMIILLADVEVIKDEQFSLFIDVEKQYITTMLERLESKLVIAYEDLIQILTKSSAEGRLVKHFPGYYGIDEKVHFIENGQKIEVLLYLDPSSNTPTWVCTHVLEQGDDYYLADYPEVQMEGLLARVKYPIIPKYESHNTALID